MFSQPNIIELIKKDLIILANQFKLINNFELLSLELYKGLNFDFITNLLLIVSLASKNQLINKISLLNYIDQIAIDDNLMVMIKLNHYCWRSLIEQFNSCHVSKLLPTKTTNFITNYNQLDNSCLIKANLVKKSLAKLIIDKDQVKLSKNLAIGGFQLKYLTENINVKQSLTLTNKDYLLINILINKNQHQSVINIDKFSDYSEQNIAWYLKYSYARLTSILNNYTIDSFKFIDLKYSINYKERILLKHLLSWFKITKLITVNGEISYLIKYLINLTKQFNQLFSVNSRFSYLNNYSFNKYYFRLDLILTIKKLIMINFFILGIKIKSFDEK